MSLRIPIRWKLLILLWLITLLPAGLLIWLDYRTTIALAEELAIVNRAAFVTAARDDLDQLVSSYALRIARERQILELLLRRQAREIEYVLAQPAGVERPAVFYAGDFDDPRRAPTTLRQDPGYFRVRADGSREALPVSFEQPVFRLAAGVDPATVADDIARLARLDGFYRSGRQRYGDWLHWRYVSLANGVHSSYPGHGGYPTDFEPRARDWYRAAQAADELVWTTPAIDATTREITVAASMPVRRNDGTFAGVAAIDVIVTRLLADYRLPERWAADGQVFMVGAGESALRVLAKQRYDEAGSDWRSMLDPQTLASSDATAFGQLLADVRAGRSGIRQLAYGDQDALWSYHRIAEPALFLLAIVPYAAVTSAAQSVEQHTLAHFRGHLQRSIPIVLAILAGAALLAYIGARAVTIPVQQLASAAEAIARGNLGARAALRTGDELEGLGRAFDAMIPKLEERVRMLETLALAREVQQRLLPRHLPRLANLDMHGATRFCDATGGDYFDFIDLERVRAGLLGIAIGDVSGHGAPSALLMCTVRALLRTHAERGATPAQVLCACNEFVIRDLEGTQFMTLYFALVDVHARTVQWANAGHAPALVYRPTLDRFFELGGKDIPLGVDAEWRYREHLVHDWEPGDLLLLATDGAWETRAPGGAMFGMERIKDLMRRCHFASAESVCAQLLAELDAFRGTGASTDDVTVLVVRAA
ncbi:MAG: SpoIIE family protein phosphatase [Gammaproteobacteria bacterium]|nr:SpoIIE family protein phosphatase [Gammaproteobacteria bacterium]